MTPVKIDFRVPAKDGVDVPVSSSVRIHFAPSALRVLDEYAVLPAPFDAVLVDGQADAVFAPSAAGLWCWTAKVSGAVSGPRRRYFDVPDTTDVLNYYAPPDATGPQIVDVDPKTLDPTAPVQPVYLALIDEKVAAGVASITRASLDVDQVDNTPDVDKPVSDAQAAALDAKANAADVYSKTDSDGKYGQVAAAGPALKSLFTTNSPHFSIWREDIGTGSPAEAYFLGRQINQGLWDCYELRAVLASASPHTLMQLRYNDIRSPLDSVNDDDASATYTGASWASVSDASAYGGTYHRLQGSLNTTQKVDRVVPSSASTCGIRAFVTTNGGYGKVLIDGDATRANLLPTAQQEVDSGRAANTILVANGGFLNPTDRVISFYAATANKDIAIPIANGLATGSSKTLTINGTGHQPIASTDHRLYIGGYTNSGPANTLATSARVLVARPFNASSVWEYATHPYNNGVPASWVGNSHGWDRQDSFTILVDGAPITLANGAGLDGQSIAVIRKSTWLDQANGTTEIAKATTTYTLAADGLHVDWQIKMLVNGTFGSSSYFGMHPRTVTWTRYKNVAIGVAGTAAAADDSVNGNAASDGLLAWNPNLQFGSLFHIPNPLQSLRNMPAINKLWYQDRISNDLKKGYATRADTDAPEPFTIGSYLHGGMVYSTQWFANPEAVLSAA